MKHEYCQYDVVCGWIIEPFWVLSHCALYRQFKDTIILLASLQAWLWKLVFSALLLRLTTIFWSNLDGSQVLSTHYSRCCRRKLPLSCSKDAQERIFKYPQFCRLNIKNANGHNKFLSKVGSESAFANFARLISTTNRHTWVRMSDGPANGAIFLLSARTEDWPCMRRVNTGKDAPLRVIISSIPTSASHALHMDATNISRESNRCNTTKKVWIILRLHVAFLIVHGSTQHPRSNRMFRWHSKLLGIGLVIDTF